MHLQRRRLELTNLDGVISASEHHRKKPRRSWSTVDFGRAPSLSKWSATLPEEGLRTTIRFSRGVACHSFRTCPCGSLSHVVVAHADRGSVGFNRNVIMLVSAISSAGWQYLNHLLVGMVERANVAANAYIGSWDST
jgi:hypothetical protein